MKKKFLSVGIHRNAPGVGDGELGMANEPASARVVAEKSAIRSPLRTKSRFHVTVEKNSFAHDDGAGRIGAEGGNRVMGVMIIEPREQNLTPIVSVVTVRILKKD